MIAYAKIIINSHIITNKIHFGVSQKIFFVILLYHRKMIATAHANRAISHKNLAMYTQ